MDYTKLRIVAIVIFILPETAMHKYCSYNNRIISVMSFCNVCLVHIFCCAKHQCRLLIDHQEGQLACKNPVGTSYYL